ncbi:MAG: hypothetical protein AABW99_00705 [archaeon]
MKIKRNDEIRQMAKKKTEAGDVKIFDFPGYAKFAYVEVDHQYVNAIQATAVQKERDHPGMHEYGKPGKYYFIVSQMQPENWKILFALHEYHEVMNGSHYQATQAERKFAKKFGLWNDFLKSKTEMARKMMSMHTLLKTTARRTTGKVFYPDLIQEIVNQTGLTRGEAQRAIKDIVKEQKTKRIMLSHSGKRRFLMRRRGKK